MHCHVTPANGPPAVAERYPFIASNSRKVVNIPKFSLRQIFGALVAVGIGLSICRLPHGNWVDIPLAALGFYFVLSLVGHAAATRQLLVAQPALPRMQRWGGRLLTAELLGAAMALTFSYLAAAELALISPTENFLDYVGFQTLPRDLAALAMLVAIGLRPWQDVTGNPASSMQKIYRALAAGGTLIVAIAYWADRMLIWFLLYLAVAGVEVAQPPAWLPPDINQNAMVRIHHFELASLGGLLLEVGNALLIGGLVKCWYRPITRRVLTISLSSGLVAECWCARWIGVYGVSAPHRHWRFRRRRAFSGCRFGRGRFVPFSIFYGGPDNDASV